MVVQVHIQMNSNKSTLFDWGVRCKIFLYWSEPGKKGGNKQVVLVLVPLGTENSWNVYQIESKYGKTRGNVKNYLPG